MERGGKVPQPVPAAPRQAPGPAAQIHTNLPADSVTVTHWYKQSVYDPADNKIGEIMDVLVDRDGKVTVLIVGVGGFLGLGEKDVAVPFNSVRATTKDNNKYYLVMNSTKDALKSAKGFKYDRNAMTWLPRTLSWRGRAHGERSRAVCRAPRAHCRVGSARSRGLIPETGRSSALPTTPP